MGFLGSFGRALGAPLRALPGGKTLAKPLNKSPLGRRVNRSLGMNEQKKPIGPSPGALQGAISSSAPMTPKSTPAMERPSIQAPSIEAPEAVMGAQEKASLQAAPPIPIGQGQDLTPVFNQLPRVGSAPPGIGIGPSPSMKMPMGFRAPGGNIMDQETGQTINMGGGNLANMLRRKGAMY